MRTAEDPQMLSAVNNSAILASKEEKKKFSVELTLKKIHFLLNISMNFTRYSFGQYSML